ncbi:MAG: beta-carotene hydroxylase [Pedobacter sp.]|nr:MAG: beta-carotene hydroxylase [Pedobacter sp.]
METLINIGIVIGTFLAMEGVAWLTHKYIMHGLFWFLHRDHHQKDHDDFLERNDFFFLIFAIPGIVCLALGNFYDYRIALYVGIGITLYGFCYFLVHDIFIHQRFKIFRNTDNWYFKAIRRAHKMHHKHINKEDGECFGMLWVPFKYFLESRKTKTI